MDFWNSRITIAEILRTNNNWLRYIAWKKGEVRACVIRQVWRMLVCRTCFLGLHLYQCFHCALVRVVPHSCKSPFCASCGKVRTDAWCQELLSDLVDVPYRHLVFTIPWQLRLLIQDNRRVLLNAMFRSGADAILSLTSGDPLPKGRKSLKWLAARKKLKPFRPGIIMVLHTFGSDLKWNCHLHVIITAGGLSLNHQRWINAPKKYLVPAPLLATEWKLNFIAAIRDAHAKSPLIRRPLRCDRRRRIDIDKLLGFVRRLRWHILIGPSLAKVDGAVRYACRYTKRPVIAEGRIEKFDQGYVTYRFKDYHRGGIQQRKTLPVLVFIDRLVQHIPEKQFRMVRYYGLFSNAVRSTCLPLARNLLAQRKKRRQKPETWADRRQAAGNRRPLSCPQCGEDMPFWAQLFGNYRSMAAKLNIESEDQVPANTILPAHTFRDVYWVRKRIAIAS